MRIRQNRTRTDRLACLGLALLALSVLGAAGALLLLWSAPPGAATDLSPLERTALSIYLAARAADLDHAAGSDPAPVVFTIEPGEPAAAVVDRLAVAELVTDAALLRYYLRYKGLDQQIEAGDITLRQTMTLAEVARALTDASARQIPVRLFEGWRLEQMAFALSATPTLSVTYESFMALAGPDGARPSGYAFLDSLPPGASLEGFLFPDTYLVAPGATSADIIAKMLTNFQAHFQPDYEAGFSTNNLSLYQAVTIASLIEREARVDDERPFIASVILNRLVIGQPLEIDATVQYALGNSENWWPPLAGVDLRAIGNPYNTYYVLGLPAGPIATPGQSSLQAVAHPAKTSYFYYRALCDGSGRHAFAVNYEEHLANACP